MFKLSTIDAFSGVRAPEIGDEIDLEEGGAMMAAVKSICVSILVLRAQVYALFGLPGGVIR